jgi:hypothetical protein
VKGRDREGQTLIYAQIMVFWDAIWQTGANTTKKMEAATACKSLVSIHQVHGATFQKSHCCENFNIQNLLQNQNLITINTATKLNFHD